MHMCVQICGWMFIEFEIMLSLIFYAHSITDTNQSLFWIECDEMIYW